jgi:hypothetical protein
MVRKIGSAFVGLGTCMSILAHSTCTECLLAVDCQNCTVHECDQTIIWCNDYYE